MNLNDMGMKEGVEGYSREWLDALDQKQAEAEERQQHEEEQEEQT